MRKQKTIKSLIRSWSINFLQMTDKDWEDIHIENIQMTENSDIIFINFKTKDDVTKFTSRAKNLLQDQGPDTPKLVMYVDQRAKKRYKAIVTIAKSMREHSRNTMQTCIRTGRNDFLLRTRPRGSNTPWAEIPPIQITQEIPTFEIGKYKDIVNPTNNTQHEAIEEDEEEEEVEDIEEIMQDISRQNNEDSENRTTELVNKRDRTSEDFSQGRRKASKYI